MVFQSDRSSVSSQSRVGPNRVQAPFWSRPALWGSSGTAWVWASGWMISFNLSVSRLPQAGPEELWNGSWRSGVRAMSIREVPISSAHSCFTAHRRPPPHRFIDVTALLLPEVYVFTIFSKWLGLSNISAQRWWQPMDWYQLMCFKWMSVALEFAWCR